MSEPIMKVRALVTCRACGGKGKFLTDCSMCDDSTYDHYCDDKEFTCSACGGGGQCVEEVTPLLSATTARPQPSPAQQFVTCALCEGKGWLPGATDLNMFKLGEVNPTPKDMTKRCSACDGSGKVALERGFEIDLNVKGRESIKPRPAEFFLPALLSKLDGLIEFYLPADLTPDALAGFVNFWTMPGVYPRLVHYNGGLVALLIEDEHNRRTYPLQPNPHEFSPTCACVTCVGLFLATLRRKRDHDR